ncbi:2-amino-4-hydroxy-6-hydroxymethyldihydropteridine diphosphokinase [Chromatium okenii]|uniref:2-amino-4-hydroxy-6- hydroxymethyldihydropteridine diphosphokinase n=1 Tax=Chromatium okenii TaxID=61644 RepID=UPI002412F7E6|nr:2-amino-4-hydroxy-6-hydroxymethyldihydropteridine diphosphokinase [Chromatium okenii]
MGEKNGSCTIDLDLLLFSDAVLNTATLQIPHSGLTQRDFMLLPDYSALQRRSIIA